MNKSFSSYNQFLNAVKQHIQAAQVKTVIAANSQMLWLYWQIGDFILQNQKTKGWGAKVIDKLSADIHRSFPQLKGFSRRNLEYMRKFAEVYPLPILQKYLTAANLLRDDHAKVHQVVAQLESTDN